jgi:heat shock protein HtpX
MQAYGLATHIWANNFRSMLLLAGFPLLLLLLLYALLLLFAGLAGSEAAMGYQGAVVDPFVWAANAMGGAWPGAIGAAGAWFGVAYVGHQAMIDAATGARAVSRQEAPELYNLLENLCISRGIPMPSLRIMETDALNAFATGLHRGQYSISVTRGLMQALSEDELEAVLAHELTHIRNHDVRLLVVAVIFVGIFSFIGELLFRGLNNVRISGRSSRSNSESGGGGGGAIVAVLAAFAIIAISYALAVAIRFALSRRREYLADAGAVELTKNPDAMIRALNKISGRSTIESAPSEVREMMIDNHHAGFGELFATHPPIEKRIKALVQYAGGRDWAGEKAAQRAPGDAKRPSPWR